MNFSGKTVLVYLEEDNTQRAYFRIRPLLTAEGPVDKEILSQYPDDGFLRIVPDKNEQHTFKERMRTLGSICVLDLSRISPETLKIRTNKNYAPAKGERNQFIVYSDAIKSLPRDLFYQVVPEDQITSALTPKAYSRSGARIQGPYDAKTGSGDETLSVLPPDSARIFSVTLPDEKELLFYCAAVAAPEQESPAPAGDTKAEEPAAESAPSPATTPVPAPAPAEQSPGPAPEKEISEMQQRLNEIFHAKSHSEPTPEQGSAPAEQETAKQPRKQPRARKNDAEEKPAVSEQDGAIHKIREMNGSLQVSSQLLKEEPRAARVQQSDNHTVGGTKLYKPAGERRLGQKARNNLAEAVDQMRVSRFESRGEAPGATINDTSRMGPVVNPLEQFRYALRRVWLMQETHRQVADQILATSGMRQMLSKVLTNGPSDLTIRAMNNQLQELEAERLMTLMELDDVKKSRKKLIETVTQEILSSRQKQIAALDKEIQTRQAQAEEIRNARRQLEDEAEKRRTELESLQYQAALTKQEGEAVPFEALVERVLDCLTRAGFEADSDNVCALLLLLAQSEDSGVMEINADSVPDARSAAKVIAAALGAPFAEINAAAVPSCPVRVIPGGDGAVFTFDTSLSPVRLRNAVHVIGLEADDTALGRLKDELLLQYTNDPWPVWWIKTAHNAMPSPVDSFPPVSVSALRDAVLKPYDGTMDDASRQLLDRTRSILKDAGAPLPLETVKKMAVFLASAKDLLKGGVAKALDLCYMAYIVPHIRFSGVDPSVMDGVVTGMPMTYLEMSKP